MNRIETECDKSGTKQPLLKVEIDQIEPNGDDVVLTWFPDGLASTRQSMHYKFVQVAA